MYSVRWQKSGLPHAYILIWSIEKMRSNDIDDMLLVKIPNKEEDPGLYEVVTKNMIHDTRGTLKNNSPCMLDGKCSNIIYRH